FPGRLISRAKASEPEYLRRSLHLSLAFPRGEPPVGVRVEIGLPCGLDMADGEIFLGPHRSDAKIALEAGSPPPILHRPLVEIGAEMEHCREGPRRQGRHLDVWSRVHGPERP